MPLITVKQGGPSANLEPGVYPVILTALNGPKTIYPANAPEGTDIFEWVFAIDDETGLEIQDNTSTASGPKSKMFGWLTALLGGKAPDVGTDFEAADLVGRTALATIGKNDNGWPKITQLTAMPKGMLAQRFAAATGTPVTAAPGTPARSALNLTPAATQAPPERRPVPARPAATGGGIAVAEAPADDLPF